MDSDLHINHLQPYYSESIASIANSCWEEL